MKRCLLLLPLLLLCACAPATTAPKATVHDDSFSPNIEIDGPLARNTDWGTGYEWRLLSLVDKKTHDVTHALYFGINYTGNRDPFTQAYDDSATSLPVVVFHPQKGSCYKRQCNWYEKSEAVLKDSFLRSHASTGFKVKMISRDGAAYILTVTPAMIKTQLEQADSSAHPAND